MSTADNVNPKKSQKNSQKPSTTQNKVIMSKQFQKPNPIQTDTYRELILKQKTNVNSPKINTTNKKPLPKQIIENELESTDNTTSSKKINNQQCLTVEDLLQNKHNNNNNDTYTYTYTSKLQKKINFNFEKDKIYKPKRLLTEFTALTTRNSDFKTEIYDNSSTRQGSPLQIRGKLNNNKNNNQNINIKQKQKSLVGMNQVILTHKKCESNSLYPNLETHLGKLLHEPLPKLRNSLSPKNRPLSSSSVDRKCNTYSALVHQNHQKKLSQANPKTSVDNTRKKNIQIEIPYSQHPTTNTQLLQDDSNNNKIEEQPQILVKSEDKQLQKIEEQQEFNNNSEKPKINSNNNTNNKLDKFVTHLNRGEIFAGKEKKIVIEEPLKSVKKSLKNTFMRNNLTPKISNYTSLRQLLNNNNYKNSVQTTKNSDTPQKTLFSSNQKKPEQKTIQKKTENQTRPQTSLDLIETPHSFIQDYQNTYYVTNLINAFKQKFNEDYFYQLYREHFLQTYQSILFCNTLKKVDLNLLKQKKINLPPLPKGKKTVVFDLDETLIHCNETEQAAEVDLQIKFPTGELINAGINVRPFAREILQEASKQFEVIVFTASHQCYANVVLDYLDPHNKYISSRLFRENCIQTDEGIYIKDLRVLGNRDLKNVILIDNAAYSFGYQITNGIPIIPYYDNRNDQELKSLLNYLLKLTAADDVRIINKDTFKLHDFHNYDSLDAIIQNLFN